MTPFTATVRSEWTKLVSLRSTKLLVVLGVVLGIVMAGLLAWVAGMTYDEWDPAGRREFEPIGTALIGGIVSAILFLVLGVKAATAEYGSGMIRLTLTATPRRGRVLARRRWSSGRSRSPPGSCSRPACSSWRRRSSPPTGCGR